MIEYKDIIMGNIKDYYRFNDVVYLKCYYCNSIYSIHFGRLMIKLKGKWLVERQTCSKESCIYQKNRDIIKLRGELRNLIALGCKHSKESIKKQQETFKKNYPNGNQFHRKGKSFEEFYGKEKAEKIIKKLSDATKEMMKTKDHPMKNKKHKESFKIKMSKSRKEFTSNEKSYIKKYRHIESNELLNWHELNSLNRKTNWKNKSDEEKQEYCEKMTKKYLDRDGNFLMHSKTGYMKHWFLKEDQKFDSSYEEAYYKKCNNEKLYWKKNLIIYIPYIHPIKKERKFYVPDILIYENSSYSKIIKIIEIKPNKFVENPKNYKSDYFEITKCKLEALKIYCKENNFECEIITEKQLGDYYEDIKNYKKSS